MVMDNRAKIRHSDVVIKTIPDLLVSVKAARGGDWPGSKVPVGELTAVVPEAMRRVRFFLWRMGEVWHEMGDLKVPRGHAFIRLDVYVVSETLDIIIEKAIGQDCVCVGMCMCMCVSVCAFEEPPPSYFYQDLARHCFYRHNGTAMIDSVKAEKSTSEIGRELSSPSETRLSPFQFLDEYTRGKSMV